MSGLKDRWLGWAVCLAASGLLVGGSGTLASDYFVTIGGGYQPSGNQASLEENVLFFQKLIRVKHPQGRVHDIFFADGTDEQADLQVAAKGDRPQRPVTELLTALHRRGPPGGPTGAAWVRYRNHEVPGIAGANDPDLIRQAFERIAKTASAGDRLIVYVTAHGDQAREGKDPFNTSITCWGSRSIEMVELTRWLDQMKPEVPVIMVMAQCYCGGFTHTIFNEGDIEKGLSKHRRIGFFAQQHDLPAAGCRPDIENDEEYSSYFWGAFIGESRTGKLMPGCDADGNGKISFDEAHAQAIIASDTIDIPMKSTDVLLRKFSRIPDYDLAGQKPQKQAAETSTEAETPVAKPTLLEMTGSIESLLQTTTPATKRVVTELCRQLELPLSGDVTQVFEAQHKHDEQHPFRVGGGPFNRGFGGGRRNSGRRALLDEIAVKWPDLADPEKWKDSELLKADDQQSLFDEIKLLPSYAAFQKRMEDREKQADLAEKHELRAVKYDRLIDTLESVLLARNLPLVATPEIVAGYQRMLELERSSLQE